MKPCIAEKIVFDHAELARRVGACRAEGRSVVWANGVFDVWHVGHTRFLAEAAAEGDVLVVGVNSDASVRRYKGPGRPVHPLEERIEIVAGQHAVDFATCFEEDTCDRMLELLRPDVHAKGPDYTLDSLPEGPTLRRLGIRFVSVAGDKRHSTSGLIRQIQGRA
ncbi:MAG: adenylyltransferase/cytidyltransferase family protein [Lentisphaerae bacterium]|nr:adenylyltransferase/cytidyltransferase family protein [Lentisphaerota bacterium]